MTSLLERTWKSDQALAAVEQALIARARELYRMGFSPENLTPSQMNGAAELLRTATDRKAAQTAVEEWMTRQLAKLRDDEKRKNQRRSWLVKPGAGGVTDSLGDELLAWLEGDRFLGSPWPEDLDRLEALCRFWERLHGFYRYEAETGTELPLAALDNFQEQEKGEEPK